ncbi:hypothetical protein [Candidatus Enterovibrio escicola]|uniref:hypothetical protein n=1 Tax=Candidatus Enterovibrio escicola TaxID=1927127 RepID=UPI0011BA4FBE|nr:hypothetical protein [Candidatus Enterovibrio escacola]
MQLGNVMIIVHAVYSLLVVGMVRSINRLHSIISYPYNRNHYISREIPITYIAKTIKYHRSSV